MGLELHERIEDAFLEWQEGVSPETSQDWIVYETFDSGLMSVFVWRHPDFPMALIGALENFLQTRVHKDLLVATLKGSPEDF